MKKFTIQMEENDTNNLQRTQYEYDTVFDLVSRNMNTPNDYWTEKLVEANMRLQLLKDEITSKYVVPAVDSDKLAVTNWSANFREGQLEVIVDD